ncbi:MAG: Iron(III) dicitrate transport system permease protein [Candidatus Carbobacillus altaicus]|uniref:Iron(III) dicitrate transport system permease protein n=1 Tax=Candidatus Carbonibacillus altaicus TaxID=2163959 RepID=A0A2R6Y561_9BACL|nr:MAG: Iron(III) dicitrate transport system permease protein [Candidatus Carbobacillus altaicus]
MVTDSSSNRRRYQGYVRRKWRAIGVVVLLTAAWALYAMVAGSAGLTIPDVMYALMGQGDARAQTILWSIRLPRILAAIVAGIGLSIAGAVTQSALRNPLATPFTLGISQGAAFGAAVAIFFFKAGSALNVEHIFINRTYIVVLFAFAGALSTTLLVIALARLFRATPEALVLSGVALSSLFQAGVMLIQYFADDVTVASIVFWTFGDLGRATWNELAIMAVAVVLASIFFLFHRWHYNAFDSGEETAKGLGISVESVRLGSLFWAAFVVAVIVSFLGVIGFIGLVGPHIMRRVIGSDHRTLLPASAAMGGLLLLASDTIGRVIVAPVILPVGIVTSVLGAPVFLSILARDGRR